MLDTSLDSYFLAVRFPRIWQANVLPSSLYAIVITVAAIGVCITITGDLKANAIPDSIFVSFRLLLFSSAIATLFWLFRSMRHFRVGVAGYKVASPPLLLLFVVIALLWVPPFVYAYCAASALGATASSEEANVGYLRLLRAATFFGADAHYESLRAPSDIGPLDPVERFTGAFVKSEAQAAVRPVELFAPTSTRSVLLSLLQTSLPECSGRWSTTSKADAVAAVQAAAARRDDRAQTEEEREAARNERASKLDRIDVGFERATREFRQCLDNALQNTKLDREEIVRAFKIAERNAYLVHYAHKSFGQNSADYLQYVSDPKFAAPELSPFGLGDVTVLSAIVWLVFLMSVFYLAGEYVNSSSFASVVRNVVLTVMALVLVLSSFGSAPSIPRFNGNPFVHDALASALHWPSLAVIGIGATGVLRTWFGPSTSRTRFLILITFLCVPVAIGIETLNTVNTLTMVDYRGSNCPKVGWILADRVHCAIYSVWQPIVRGSEVWLANQLHWPLALGTIGGRAAISAILAILIAWPISSIGLVLLKREFVRPRDK